MTELSDAVAEKTYKRMMRYFHRKRLAIPFGVTSQEFRQQVRELSERLEIVNPLNLMQDGPVRSNMNPLHARFFASELLREFVEAEKADRLAYEDTLKNGGTP